MGKEKINEQIEKRFFDWFDIQIPEGFFSLHDKVQDIVNTEEGRKLLLKFLNDEIPDGQIDDTSFNSLVEMMGDCSLLQMLGMMSTMDVYPSEEKLLQLNQRLNQIRKGDCQC